MEYPLISEYIDSILAAEDYFNELASLRPVLDSHGKPVMSSGNFAVVFKMRDENDGKIYAVKCFLKDQEGRADSYRKIADELEVISSSYILPLRYLENELFVDSNQCDCEEFPVVVMEWVEGVTLDSYLKRHLNDKYELEMISYHFNRLSAWLLAQPFAHGDLKPDNILVRGDGSLVLVDYDGMFVPSMKGENAREIGTPGYRHPLRTDSDFNEHIDDFSIALIAMSLKAIALNPALKAENSSADNLLLSEQDLRSPQDSVIMRNIQSLTNNSELAMLYGIFYIALANKSLESISFRLFITDKPKAEKPKKSARKSIEKIDTSCSGKDLAEGVKDEYGVVYSADGKRLLKCDSGVELFVYTIKSGTQVICNNAFYRCGSLQSIVIPDSVTSIGNGAFSWCNSLQSIVIPDSVTSIGNEAFLGCESLQSIVISASITSIGNKTFSCCYSLQSIVIPDSVTSIGDNTFSGCDSLQSILIPVYVTSIGNGAFRRCESLQGIVIPDSVTSISNDAFSRCESLQSIVIPDSVTSIGNGAFSRCSSLQSIVIPDSVISIGANPFEDCPDVKVHLSSNSNFRMVNDLLIDSQGVLISCLNKSENVNIPDSVSFIGNNAFKGCDSLQSIVIPDSVTSIGNGAFDYCRSLQSIVIPASVTSIGNNPFVLCPNVKVHLSPTSNFNMVNDLLIDSQGVLISCLDKSKYVIIPASVTSIGNRAFCGCSFLQSIAIPDSITSIGNEAFCGCSSLQSIVIPDSITSIGNRAIFGCGSLQSIVIPDSVTTIGNGVFDYCRSLQSIVIPDSVTSIGNRAFFGCSSLQSIVIPDSVTSIGLSAFPDSCKVIRRKRI